MLNPEVNRINYSEAIIPPVGYELESAICTTYSLDFEALIAITMALGFSIDTPQKEKENKALMFKALRDISEKLIIYCEAGQIKMPNIPNSMYILLEKMIVPVSLDLKNGTYPAFHPKTWFLEYKEKNSGEKGKRKYRFFILSRNLTFDKSWDISLFLDGTDSGSYQAKSKPLIPFYEFLNNEAIKCKCRNQAIISSILSKMENINFVCDSYLFSDYEIVPIGVSEKYGMHKQRIFNLTEKEQFDDLLIMSPFLSSSIVDYFCKHLSTKSEKQTRNNILITRRTALEKINKKNADYLNIYALKEYFDDVQEETNNQTTEINKELLSQGIIPVEKRDKDIHGKIFITQLNGTVDLYLGSMNATKAAKDDNIEMMIRLRFKNRTIRSFVDDILSYKKTKENSKKDILDLDYFELINLNENKPEDISSDNNILKDIIKNICRLNLKAYVPDDSNKIIISIDQNQAERELKKIHSNGEIITISPISVTNNSVPFTLLDNKNDVIEISYNEIQEISEYYIVSVKQNEERESAVIKIQTDNMPNREDALIKSILSDSKTLLEYFQILFSDNSQNIYDLITSKNEKKGKSQGNYLENTAFYEMMLKTALNNKPVMDEFATILSKVPKNSDIIKKLDLLYEQFVKAMN